MMIQPDDNRIPDTENDAAGDSGPDEPADSESVTVCADDNTEPAATMDSTAGMPSNEGAATTACARARVYGLLAATFYGEVEIIATALEDGAFRSLAATLPGDIETDALDRSNLDSEALSLGYDNLFVVPGPHYVPPFASAHADDPSEAFESDSPYHDTANAGELFGDPAAEAAALYTATGFKPERGEGIPDHIAAMFEFMRALCTREADLLDCDGAVDGNENEALSTVREAQRETLARLGWLDAFDEAVDEKDRAEGVFAMLARLARTFAAWDARVGVAVE